MFGNLVCLSPTGKFDDPIWATVAEKDTELLNNQQIIELELVSEFNKISTTEALLILMTSANYAVMVESPVYFHSKKPVLKALQSFKMDKFTLEDEVVAAKSSGKKPLYLEDNTQLNVKSSQSFKLLFGSHAALTRTLWLCYWSCICNWTL